MIIDELENEQKILHERITQALKDFSDRTGITVEAMNWDVATVRDDEGKYKASEYWAMRSSLGTNYT